MKQFKAWLSAARLRTLPLSISGIIVGMGITSPNFFKGDAYPLMNGPYAGGRDFMNWESPIFWLAIFTTIGFQVLSNFANDYGDGVKGTDANREGEKRMVASGLISPKQMKRGMYITAAISLLLASMLIFAAFGNSNFILAFVFFNLAIFSVIAAIKYTVGDSAYGYSGFGDVFVFVFFGIVSVLGSYFLVMKNLDVSLILPAISIGCFSTSVLNLNNMRDIDNDRNSGKNTLVVKLGSKKAKNYHYLLLVIGMICGVLYTFLNYSEPLQFVYVIAYIPFLWNIRVVLGNKEPRKLDGELKKVALSTFLFAVLFAWLH